MESESYHSGRLLDDDLRPSQRSPTGKDRAHPYALVWTPLPLLTWLLPFIGHMGITTSNGVIYDFSGPYHVGVGDFMLGPPARYLPLEPSLARGEEWDSAVKKASDVYCKRMHILCWDNCHSHVAHCLNLMEYKGSTSWNMVYLAFYLFIFARYSGVRGFLRTWAPFLIIVTFILLLCLLIR